MDIPLSLWFGGYDRSRILGPVSSQPYTRFDFLMDLLDIGIGVDNGASPFEFSERQGILRQGSASMGDSTQVILDPQSPYLYLPQSTCDAIASYLPVTYQSKYKLYFWDTKDPKYQPIITSPSYLSFTFRASNMEQNNITVKVPFQLLNLTLQMPIIDTPTQYFPCQPVGAKDSPSYTLGRAFLQAAFLGVHWDEDRGLFYLAQAPGPNTARTPQQQEFNTTLSSSTNTWSDTWAGHWTPISETRSTINSTNGTATATASGAAATTSSAAKEGLSTGAKAGIGLGCAAVLALVAGVGLYLSRSRSRARTTSEASSQRPAVVKENERQGMKGPDIPPLVQAADPEPVEIQDKEPLHELPTEVR
ncbi:MAG: hypothetical protein L6R39_002085 [Caloplaca ligustica]|nr:MAG: hypothetical protein L6R39_002085 [Caloplaca ligustica]